MTWWCMVVSSKELTDLAWGFTQGKCNCTANASGGSSDYNNRCFHVLLACFKFKLFWWGKWTIWIGTLKSQNLTWYFPGTSGSFGSKKEWVWSGQRTHLTWFLRYCNLQTQYWDSLICVVATLMIHASWSGYVRFRTHQEAIEFNKLLVTYFGGQQQYSLMSMSITPAAPHHSISEYLEFKLFLFLTRFR